MAEQYRSLPNLIPAKLEERQVPLDRFVSPKHQHACQSPEVTPDIQGPRGATSIFASLRCCDSSLWHKCRRRHCLLYAVTALYRYLFQCQFFLVHLYRVDNKRESILSVPYFELSIISLFILSPLQYSFNLQPSNCCL